MLMMLACKKDTMLVRRGWFRNKRFSKTRTATLIAFPYSMETQVRNPLCEILFSEDQLRSAPIQTHLEICPSGGACERLDAQSSEPDIRHRLTDQAEQGVSEEQVPPPVSISTTDEGCPATKPQAELAASVSMDAAAELLVGADDADLELQPEHHDADVEHEHEGVEPEDTGVKLAEDALEDADLELEDADVELASGLVADASASDADAAAAGPRLGRLRRMGEGHSAVSAGLAPLPALLQQQPKRVLKKRITVKSSGELPDEDEEEEGGGGGDPLMTAAAGGREFTERMVAEGEDGGDEDAADGDDGVEEEEEGEYWDEEDEYMEQLLQDDDEGEQVIGNCGQARW